MAQERLPRARLEVRLSGLDDLFRTPDPAQFPHTGRLVSGIDELLMELRARRLPRRVHTVVTTTGGGSGGDAANLAGLIRGYCEIRLRDLAVELRAQQREQVRSLLVGLLLFIVGIALSSEFAADYWPGELKSVLGDGVFLVIAWVGLWYPLDNLVFGRRALLGERRVLRLLRATSVEVRHVDAAPAAPPVDAAPRLVPAGGKGDDGPTA